jgi:peptide/nickel transport system substrate-binding protein
MPDLFYSADGNVMGAVLSRRKALRTMGMAGVLAGAAGLLAACGGSAAVAGNSSSASVSAALTTSAGTASASSASPTSATTSAGSTSSTSASSAATSSAATSSAATSSASTSASAATSSSASAAAAATMGTGQFNGGWPYQVPPTGNWNFFVTNHVDLGLYNDLIVAPFAKYSWSNNTWLNLLASDFKVTPPDKFVVTLRSGLKWSDGSDFTPKDVLTTFSIGRLLSFPVWNYLDTVTASGNDITFHMSKPSSVVQRYVLEQNLVADTTFGSWAQKADALFAAGKTSADAEVKTLITDFEKFRPTSLLASGPFMYDPTLLNSAQLTLVRNPHGYAQQVQFAKIVIYNGETPTITPLVLAKEIDYATHGFPPASVKQFQAEGLRILTPPSYSGAALYINYAKLKDAAKPEVRQALAYLTDRAANATFSLGQSAKAQQYMAGMPDEIVPLWVQQGDLSKFNQYAKDTAKATSLLQAAGWKKGSDGVWVDSTGAKWDYQLQAPSDYADWSAGAQNLAEQLSSFGLKTVVQGVVSTQANQQMLKGDFVLAIQGWGAGSPFPQFDYQSDILANVPPQDVLGPGISFNLQQTTKSAGAVNFKDLVVAAGEGLDVAPQKVAVTKMAQAFNEILPIIPIWEKYGNNPVLQNVRVTGWPPDSDPLYKNDYYTDSFVSMWMYQGVLKPVAK